MLLELLSLDAEERPHGNSALALASRTASVSYRCPIPGD